MPDIAGTLDDYRNLRIRLEALANHIPESYVEAHYGQRFDSIVREAEALTGDEYSKFRTEGSDYHSSKRVANQMFMDRPVLAMKLAAFVRFWATQEDRFSNSRPKRSVVAERSEVLSTLVAAVTSEENSDTIHMFYTDFGVVLKHSGFEGGEYTPAMSHLRALRTDRLIAFEQSRGDDVGITLPTHVLDAFERAEGDALDLDEFREKVNRLANSTTAYQLTVNHGNANFAIDSKNVRQELEVTTTVSEGDFGSLRTALEKMGIDAELIMSLKNAIESDEREHGRRTVGSRVRDWLGGLAVYGAIPVSTEVIAGVIMKYIGSGL